MTTTTISFLMSLLATSTVLGCGPLFPGKSGNALTQWSECHSDTKWPNHLAAAYRPNEPHIFPGFTVSNLRLTLPMVYTVHEASQAIHPNVSRSAMQAQTFVRNLVMIAMNDVLERQGRSAGLPDAVISAILDQLMVDVAYEPLKCDTVSVLTAAFDNHRIDNKENCIVTSEIVNSICTKREMAMCNGAPNLKDVSQQPLTITGTLKIGNLIMAGWSQQMWQTILNRGLQVLSSGTFGTSFQAASVNIV